MKRGEKTQRLSDLLSDVAMGHIIPYLFFFLIPIGNKQKGRGVVRRSVTRTGRYSSVGKVDSDGDITTQTCII